MAESAKRAGYDFVTLDYFGDADQKEICENYSLNHEFEEEYRLDNLFRHSRDLEFTHAIYGSGFENRPELVAELEGRCTVLGNPSKTLKEVRNWKRFFRVLKKENILFPRTEVVSLEEAKEVVRKDKRWLIKPLKSGGGHGICEGWDIGDVEGLGEEVMVQEYINGKPASATVICSKEDCLFLGATEQLIGDSFKKYRYVGNIAPLEGKKETIEKIERTTGKIAKAFGLKGSNSIDFLIKKDEPYVVEVNPRITGAMEVLERAYSINILELHGRACMGELAELEIGKPRGFFGKRILFADKNITFKINGLDFVKDVPHRNELIGAGNPVCTVFGEGNTVKQCRIDLWEKEKDIRRLLEG